MDADIQKAFDHPEDYDWSGVPNCWEAAILEAIDNKTSFLECGSIYDRKRMEDIVNRMARESIMFQHRNGGLKLTVV